MQWLKQSTSITVRIGPFVDDSDGKTAETGLTISQADIRLSKNGGDFAQTNDSGGATHDESGWYSLTLDATDTNTVGRLDVAIHESGALPVWREFVVVAANIWDSLFGNTDKLQVDATQIEGSDATDQINAACDTALSDINLDHLMKTAAASGTDMTTEVADGTVLSNLMTKAGDTSDYSRTTDSFEALGEKIIASTIQVVSVTDAGESNVFRDAYWDVDITGIGDISGRDTSGDKLYVTVKVDALDDDDDAIFKASEGSGLLIFNGDDDVTAGDATITVTDAAAGDLTLTVKSATTTAAPLHEGLMGEIKYIRESDDEPIVQATFTLNIRPAILQAVS